METVHAIRAASVEIADSTSVRPLQCVATTIERFFNWLLRSSCVIHQLQNAPAMDTCAREIG